VFSILKPQCQKTVVLQHSTSWSGYHSDPSHDCFGAIAALQIHLRIDMWGALEIYLYCIVLHCTHHSTVYAVLWTEKLNLLNKQTVFLLEQCAESRKVTTVRCAVFRPRHRLSIALLLAYCPVKVRPEIRCLAVSRCYCRHGNHAAGSKPI